MRDALKFWATFLTEKVLLLYFSLCFTAMWIHGVVTDYEGYDSSLASINILLSNNLIEYGSLVLVICFMISALPFFKGDREHNALLLGGDWLLFIARFSLLTLVSLFFQRIVIPAIASELDSHDTIMSVESLLSYDLLLVVIVFIVTIRIVLKSTSLLVTKNDAGEPLFAGVYIDLKNTETAAHQDKISEEDFKIACQHEAGHIMTFAFLKSLPPHLKVSMGGDQHKGSLGRVSYSLPVSRVGSLDECEFSMLLGLGGIAAERHYNHHNLLGGSGDIEGWITDAKVYFSLGRNGYNVKPDTEFEHVENKHILNDIQARQFALLALFFVNNSGQLDRIWQEIYKHKRLAKNQVEFLLGPLSLEGMPCFDLNHDPDTLKIIL